MPIKLPSFAPSSLQLPIMAPRKQPPSFAHVEQAALHILRLIRDTPGLENTKVAVVGDLALRHYLPDYNRVTVSRILLEREVAGN